MQFIVESLKNKRVYIFGAGTRGQYLCPILERYSIHVEAFIDNNFDKCGESICGKKIIDLDTLLEREGLEINIIVSPLDNAEIIKQLANLRCKNICDGSEILEEISYLPIKLSENDFKNVCPFNHYESPYPDIKEIHEKEQAIYDINRDILDIDFNLKLQFEYLEKMKQMEIIDWESKKEEYRYHYNNGWFDKGSADVLYYII